MFKETNHKADIIIACDTVVSVKDVETIEKAIDQEDAIKMLRKLSDAEVHEVLSSIWIAFVDPETMTVKQLENITDRTKVYMHKLDDYTIEKYVASGEAFGISGAYYIQGMGASFIEKIEGDQFGVWGLPMSAFCKTMIKMFYNDLNA